MRTSVPDAAAFLSAAHHRELHRKAKAKAKPRGATWILTRVAIVAVILACLIAGVNAVMFTVLG
jgi:Flp pilus assembly protein TadB